MNHAIHNIPAMLRYILLLLAVSPAFSYGCRNSSELMHKRNAMKRKYNIENLYGYNKAFLGKYTQIIELKSGNSAIILVPAWQGRVMTSTAEGENGFSFGWINHNLISSGELQPHINAYGGEERFWLGPEGGQYSVFFPQDSSFTFENWQTPPVINTESYEVVEKSANSVLFRKEASLVNYSGFNFKLKIERRVTLLHPEETPHLSEFDFKGLNIVAYSSSNTITNTGNIEWKKETGLLSIWMLGMFNPSPSVVVIIPVREGATESLGPIVNDNYFGSISSDRLKIIGNHVFFKADGKSRGKIGIPPLRTTGVMGSYDFENNILNLLFCDLPEGETDYVNSAWELQENPYSGDAYNSYNDGPLEDGYQMGPFYELETSSPAAKLKPGESLTHVQITVHLSGKKEKLIEVSEKILGVNPDKIAGIFN